MAISVERVLPYVPGLVLRYLSGEAVQPGMGTRSFQGAVLFTDISGFTPLAESFAKQGDGGAEALSALLNAFYGPLIERIGDHGGDVAKLAGDALVALWCVDGEVELADLTLRAARCALDVQALAREIALGQGVRLALKAGIGCGGLLALFVGGVRDRWELLLAGSPLVQMSQAERRAEPGEIILSPEAARLCGKRVQGFELPGGFLRLAFASDSPAPVPCRQDVVSTVNEQALWGYLTGSIRARLQAGQQEWLAELRRVTVLFVHLPGFHDQSPEASLRVHETIRSLQEAIYRHEGSLNKLSLDDKGITLVVAFGLPPLAHEDDAARGVLAAQAMADALDRLGGSVSIGVATGRVYCGEIGGSSRREYTIIGDVVNLSARLMQAAGSICPILCDEATVRSAGSRLRFESLSPIIVKGKRDPVSIFRPIGREVGGLSPRKLFGRTAERSALESALQDLAGGLGRVIVLEGEPGLGKSSLVAELLRRAQELGIHSHFGRTDPVESTTPYFAWRRIVAGLLGLEGTEEPGRYAGGMPAELADLPELAERMALLNDLLPLELPETDVTARLTGQVRADNLRELLLRLIALAAEKAPRLIVLEDAHWLDSTSWSLTRALAAHPGRVLLVVTTRPAEERRSEAHALVSDQPGRDQFIRLDPLPADDILALALDRLGVNDFPPVVARLIRDRAEGHPLFAEELALSLRDAGLLVVEDRVCRIAESVDLGQVRLPDSMHGAIVGRIDRLPPSHQMTLKSASVIGRFFLRSLLREIYPIKSDQPVLDSHLDDLGHQGFTIVDPDLPDDGHAFKHVITREAAYHLMLASQKRTLHREVASWYERKPSAELSPHFALLAYHWEQAGETDRAIDYLIKAGQTTLRGGSYNEAIGFLRRAIALGKELDSKDFASRASRAEQLLGEALLAIGDLESSRIHIERSLDLLGCKPPARLIGLAAGLAVQVGRQTFRLLLSREPLRREHPNADHFLRLATADSVLGQLCYFSQELVLGVHSALRGLNAAEQAGPSAPLAQSYATVAVAASLVPVFPVARLYAARALSRAEHLEDLQAKSFVLELVGITELDSARWQEARTHLQQAAEIAERINDWRRWAEAAGELARLELHQGRFQSSLELFRLQFDRALRLGHDQSRIWGLHGQALNRLRLGEHQTALELLEQSPAIGQPDRAGLSDVILGGGLLAVASLRSGQSSRALQAAQTTVSQIRSARAMVGYAFDGYAGVAEVLVELARAGLPNTTPLARFALRALRSYARVFPIAWPRAYLLRSRWNRLLGRPLRALRDARRAVHLAKKLAMPHELTLSQTELNRLSFSQSPTSLES